MNIHKHKSQSNNKTNNNNQLTPELNHHLIPSRNSRSLAQALPTKNKRWNSSSQKPAFTIIEVVLVLAIAGLIFLMVFIALPALQRNQRDTQRKNDMSRLKTTIDSYKSNNRGNLPWGTDRYGVWSQSDNFGINYLKADQGEFNDPSRGPYQLTISRPYMIPGYKPALQDSWISIFIGGKCDGEVLALADGSSNYSIQYILEGGGVYCIDG
mgnify:CR=1 FL=1